MMVKRSMRVMLDALVVDKGYEIVEAAELDTGSELRYGEGLHRMITHGLAESVFQTLAMRVEPLELDPAIHRNFASLGPNDELLREFASSFGLLHGGLEVQIEIPGGEVSKRLIVSIGEPVEIWTTEVDDIRESIRLWDWMQNRDLADLEEYFGSQTREFPTHIQAALQSGDYFRPAMFLIAERINKRLAGETDACFDGDDNNVPEEFVLILNSLRAGLWFMLALEIHDDKKYKSCAACGKWYEIKTGSRRASRVYCSNACRTKTYRGRQDQAKRLYENGTSIGDIARELETDAKTVERWVGSSSQDRSS